MHRWTVILVMAALALAVADAASTANLLLGGDDDDQRAENEWSSTYRLLGSTHKPSANSADAILAALDDLPRTWDAAPRLTPAHGRGQETDADRYQVPKRALSLLTRWKTLEQLRRNGLNQRSAPMSLSLSSSPHSRRQTKKQQPPQSPKEEFQLPAMSQDMITAVARGYHRSLRPPGQPLRWG